MANMSPGVEVRERDVSLRVPSSAGSTGAMVGHFEKGPLNVITLINSEDDLLRIYGKPNDVNFRHWFTCQAFLRGSDRLYLLRTEDSNTKVAGATVGISGTGEIQFWETPRVSEDFPILDISQVSPFTAQTGSEVPVYLPDPDSQATGEEIYHIWAIGAGTYYNNVSVAIVNAHDFNVLLNLKEELAQAILQEEEQEIIGKYYTGSVATTGDPTASTGDYLSNSLLKNDLITPPSPATNNEWVINNNLLNEWSGLEFGPEGNDEILVFVYNEDIILEEAYLVSSIKGKRDSQGNKMYAPEIINGNSNYIYFFIGASTDSAGQGIAESGNLKSTGLFRLGGADPLTENIGQLTGEIEIAWRSYFTNKELLEFDLLLDPDYVDILKRTIDDIAKNIRKDCFALLNMPESQMVNPLTKKPRPFVYTDMKNFVQTQLNINSSYSAIYGNYFKIFDPYNEVERWVPVTGFIGATIARVDFNQAQWWAPAGLNRGIVENIIDIAINPTKAQRDIMYYNRINPIVNFFGQGIVIWGQKTMQAKPSAFDRINVRRLFLYMERAIEKLARFFIFELNDELTRSRFRGLVNGFLSEIKARRGVFDFLVVADETNNTPEIIDRNEFVAEILVKPTRVIEFIKLTFTAVSTGVDFSEVVERR